MLKFSVITLFPQMFASSLGHSILKKAQEKSLISVRLVNLRDHTIDRHRTADDSPYGGGHGMVMKAEPLMAAIEEIRENAPAARVILLSPKGKVFIQKDAARLAREKALEPYTLLVAKTKLDDTLKKRSDLLETKK